MQKVPDPGFRVDSGPLQFGDDWPGVFFRGDDAGPKADIFNALARVMRAHGVPEQYARYLDDMASEFSKCVVNPSTDSLSAKTCNA